MSGRRGVMPTFRSIILILITGLCAACSMHDRTEIPEFSVSNLQFEGVTVFETSATIEVRIDNPNPYPLTLHGGVHRLYINDVYLGRGFDKDNVTIDKLSSVSRPVSVHINNMALISQMQEIVLKPELSYRIESVLYRDALGQRFEVEDSGSIAFEGVARSGARRYSRVVPMK